MKRTTGVFIAIALALFAEVTFTASCFAQRHPESIEALFEEEFKEVKGEAPNREKERKHRELITELLKRITAQDVETRFQVGRLLRRAARKGDVQPITAALTENAARREVQIELIYGLAATKDPAAVPILRKEFDGEEDPAYRMAIIDALPLMADDAAVPFLADILATPLPDSMLMRAASALGKIGTDKAIYVLEATLVRLGEGPVKTAASWALEWANGGNSPGRTDAELAQAMKQVRYFKGQQYFFYRPTVTVTAPERPWLLVCVHDNELNAEQIFDTCFQTARAFKLAVVAPLFDNLRFPEFGTFNVQGDRADRALLELIDFVGKTANVKTKEIYFYGFGAGGDFVQRFTVAYPGKIARSAFHTERFMVMDSAVPFPEGLKPEPYTPDLKFDLAPVLKTDFAAMLDGRNVNGKPFRTFTQGLSAFGEKQEISSRARWRFLQPNTLDLSNSWKVASQYLFPSS